MTTIPPHARKGKVYTVYTLIDPRDHVIRYVGITHDVYQRMRQHSRCEGNNEAKNAWVRELQNEQLMFIMSNIEQVETWGKALERESYWIKTFLGDGVPLLNIAVVDAPKNPTQVQCRPGRNSSDKDHAYNVWLFQTYSDLFPDVWRNKEKFKSYVKHHPPKLIFSPEEGFRPNPKKRTNMLNLD